MVRITRSATLQMRVTPGVKRASEEILHQIGLSMTDAIEIFLRQMIVEQRIPFEIVALDVATLERIETLARQGKKARHKQPMKNPSTKP